ncbi:MAG: carboxymuconolactone decarboxylase family protein [Dehalococcoidia bacterium]
MQSFEELSKKSHEWREWYYDGEPKTAPVAKSVEDAFELINATLFGHIYQRPALDGKIRSLCTIAALVVLDRPNQLPGHITGALNYGWTKEQIVELITQMLFYGGYPCTVNALNSAAKAFEDYDKRHAND